jgi:hypothetical protein
MICFCAHVASKTPVWMSISSKHQKMVYAMFTSYSRHRCLQARTAKYFNTPPLPYNYICEYMRTRYCVAITLYMLRTRAVLYAVAKYPSPCRRRLHVLPLSTEGVGRIWRRNDGRRPKRALCCSRRCCSLVDVDVLVVSARAVVAGVLLVAACRVARALAVVVRSGTQWSANAGHSINKCHKEICGVDARDFWYRIAEP